jgi:hypothetical protein
MTVILLRLPKVGHGNVWMKKSQLLKARKGQRQLHPSEFHFLTVYLSEHGFIKGSSRVEGKREETERRTGTHR